MTKTQGIPVEIMAEARRVVTDDLGLDGPGKIRDAYIGVIADALLARDTAARKECADKARGIASTQADGWIKNPSMDGCGGATAASNTGFLIAAAIEATLGDADHG